MAFALLTITVAFGTKLSLRVFDAANNKMIKSDLSDFGGYDPKLFLGDFTGDKVKEIMVSAPIGGSGGIIDNRIVTLAGGETKLIFGENENNSLTLSGSFQDNFKANVLHGI